MTYENKLKLGIVRFPLLLLISTLGLAALEFPTDIKLNIANIAFLLASYATTKIMSPTFKEAGVGRKLMHVTGLQFMVYYAVAFMVWNQNIEQMVAVKAVGIINFLLFMSLTISLFVGERIMTDKEEKEFEEARRRIFNVDDEEENDEEETEKRL